MADSPEVPPESPPESPHESPHELHKEPHLGPPGSGDEAPVCGLSDELLFEPVVVRKEAKRWGRLLPVLIVMTLVAGGGWYFFAAQGNGGFAGYDGNLPIVRAESGIIKIRPDSPGGMDVPDRDKMVYRRMEGGYSSPPVERLLPSAEEALPRPDVPTTKDVLAVKPPPDIPEVLSSARQAAPTPEPTSEPASAPVVPTPVVPTAKDVLAVRQPPPAPPAPEPVLAKDKKTVTKKPAKTKKSGSDFFKVQLAAVRTTERARVEWERLSHKHFKLLGSLELFVTKVDLGLGKGVLYRLRAGPIASENAAKELCKGLAMKKVGCLIVRPGG